ncbi:MAG: hypothetical protein ACYS8W_14815 [Planctomycetota bacterium]|jgi:peptidoglycan/LPS O-acetylase OafA/YrhL
MEIFAIIFLVFLLLAFVSYMFHKKAVDERMKKYNWIASIVFCVLGFLVAGALAIVAWVSPDNPRGDNVWSARIMLSFEAIAGLVTAVVFYINRDRLKRSDSPEVELPSEG